MNQFPMKLRWWIGTGVSCVVLCLSLVAWTGCSDSAPAPGQKGGTKAGGISGRDKPVRVKFVQAQRERLKRTTTLPVHIDGYEKTDLYARVTGYLHKINVDIGDRVKKDDVLAELWIPEMDQEILQKIALLDRAKSMLGQAEAAATTAQAMVEATKAVIAQTQADVARFDADAAYRKGEYERYDQLRRENAVRGEIVDEKLNQFRAAEAAIVSIHAKVATARANLKVEEAKRDKAKADVDSAKSNVRLAESNLEHTRIMAAYGKITAPFDGVITRRMVDSGAFIQSAASGKSDPLFSIVMDDRLRIIADVAEADSSLLKLMQPAMLRVDALLGRQFPCKVVRFSPALDRGTRTMRAELELDVHDLSLRRGMFGAVTIELANKDNALILDTNVLLPAAGKPAVMVVENGIARRREIVIGGNDGIRMHVMEGLTGDEDVISEGKNIVREGQAVAVVK